MKYRILQKDDSFYPQYKGWFFWYYFYRRATSNELCSWDFTVIGEECCHSVSYHSPEDADRYINNKIKESKIPKHKVIKKIIKFPLSN